MNLVLAPLLVVAIIIGVVAIPFLLGVILYNVLRLVFFLVARVVALVGGWVLDVLRFVGHILGAVLHVPLALINAVFLRFGDAKANIQGLGREVAGLVGNVWSAVALRPLRFLGFIERERVEPEAMPAMDADELDFDAFDDVAAEPVHQMGKGEKGDKFEGYKLVGTLPRGGSGARLYVAEPKKDTAAKIARRRGEAVEKVVIKSFSMDEGSTMPQIVRESRALEAARDLGLVLEHRLEKARFYYVMPYVAGEDLATVTRDLHHDSGAEGLNARSLRAALSYFSELLVTVERFHTQGLWHKDIKPSNVIVSKGRVHLVDLGLVTPLRSAMTLTTHGTEYFRDPEMVRLAMQGVKVHEVDGVKFDLYSAGALLYSMLENSFPAHGSLSRFSKQVPDVLKWIVRRAMAEMHQRYAAAADMLADLQVVLESPNPYMLKPSALPSMQGKRVRLADWQAGAPGAAFRKHGYRDQREGNTVFSAGFEERVREAGGRLNDAGERVYNEMQRVTKNLHVKVHRHTARMQSRFEKRAEKAKTRHRINKGRVIAASILLVLLAVPAFLLVAPTGMTSHSGPMAFHYEGFDGRRASARSSTPRVVTASHGKHDSPPAPEWPSAHAHAGESLTMSQHVSEQVELPRVPTIRWDSTPRIEWTSAPRVEPISPLLEVTPHEQYELLMDLDADERLLLIDDLAGAEAERYREALRGLKPRVWGAGLEEDSELEVIDLLAEARRLIGFASPDDPEALVELEHFIDESGVIDAVYWIGRDGERVVGRLVE